MENKKMENKKELDDFASKAIPILKQKGYLKETSKILLGAGFLLLGFFFAIILVYGINSDAFKSIISQEVECPNITCPNCNCPSCPECPTPYVTCENTCEFPQNLSIKINST